MSGKIDDSDVMLLQAYADGELDASQAGVMRQRIESEPALKSRYESILALRKLVRAIPDEYLPPDRLREKISAAVRPANKTSWRALAAAALLGAVLSGLVGYGGLRQNEAREVSTFAVANHVRSQLAMQPFDVASSDRHTIKPWFATKLPESPPVVDLSADGFALAGGRVDVVVRDPAATAVYRRGPHAISLTALRGARAALAGEFSGYNVESWQDGDFTYVAVSDIPAAELSDFKQKFLREIRR